MLLQDIQFWFLSFLLIRKINIFLFNAKEKFEIEMPKAYMIILSLGWKLVILINAKYHIIDYNNSTL